jgi:hypothetical protein
MCERCDWMVRVYNKFGRIVDSWRIDNRTENEAESEAIRDVEHIPDMTDWYLVKIND